VIKDRSKKKEVAVKIEYLRKLKFYTFFLHSSSQCTFAYFFDVAITVKGTSALSCFCTVSKDIFFFGQYNFI